MQVLGSRRGGLITLSVAAVALVVAVGLRRLAARRAAVGGPQPLPGPGSAVSDATPGRSPSACPSADRLGDLQVTRRRPRRHRRASAARGDRLALRPATQLGDGTHSVERQLLDQQRLRAHGRRAAGTSTSTRTPRSWPSRPRPTGALQARRAAPSSPAPRSPAPASRSPRGGKTATAVAGADGRLEGRRAPARRAASPPPSRRPTRPATPPRARRTPDASTRRPRSSRLSEPAAGGEDHRDRPAARLRRPCPPTTRAT